MSAIEADPLQAELEFQLVGIVLGLVRFLSQPSSRVIDHETWVVCHLA